MPQLVIDNFFGGIAPSINKGKAGSYYSGISVDPIRDIGFVSGGYKGAKITYSSDGVIANYINSFISDPVNQKIYAIESGAKLHRLSTLNLTASSAGTFPYTISAHAGHSSVVGEDVIMYPIGTSFKMFYSWNDNTDGDIGMYDLNTTFDSDYMSISAAGGAALTKGVPHQMIEWQNSGKLYITNGRYLSEFDGQTGTGGTFDVDKFALPVGWCQKSVFNAGDLLGVAAEYVPGAYTVNSTKRNTAVFFWDGVSTQWIRQINMELATIYAGFNLNNEIYIFGEDGIGQSGIYLYDGSRFRLEQPLYVNLDVDHNVVSTRSLAGYRSVCEFKGGLLMVNTRGLFMWYGSPQPGMPKSLYNITTATNTTIDANGLSDTVGQSVHTNSVLASFIASSKESSTYQLDKYFQNFDGQFKLTTTFYEFPRKIRVNKVKLFFKTLTSGMDDDIKLTTDYGKETITLGSIAYASDGALQYKSFKIGKNCRNFRIQIDTDEVNATVGIQYSKIVVDYDFVDDAE